MKRYRAIAEYYDFENERLSMLRQDVPFFLGHLPKRKRQDVLELAVGTARAAIPIAQAGHRVVGVDYAPDMLAIATRKRDAVGLRERELRLVRGDVLKLDLGRRFDWVAIFFNTLLGFTTLGEQDRLLKTIVCHLKPRDGRLWLDIFQPDLRRMGEPLSRGIDPSAFYVPRYERTVFRTVDVRRDPAKQLMRVTFHYRWFDDRGREHRERTAFDMTYIMPRELRLLIERHGLRIERLYGNYDGSTLSGESPRMIACCCLA
jgi:SAM-dependent methyltransferase